MCGVLILIRGDHRRAGEVGHALSSAHLSGLQLVTHNTVTDDNVHIDTKHIDTNNIDSDSSNSNSNNSDSDNSQHSNATFIPSSLLQQACPFSMSDFDTSLQMDEESSEIFVTISGYSSTQSIREQFKKDSKKSTEKAKPLRSTLCTSSSSTNERTD